MSSPPIRRTEDGQDLLDPVPSWLSVGRQVAEPPRPQDIIGTALRGDRALNGLNRLVPEAPPQPEDYGAESPRAMVWRFFLLAGAAAVIAWSIVLLPSLKKSTKESAQSSDLVKAPSELGPLKHIDAQTLTEASSPLPGEAAAVSQPRAVTTIPVRAPAASPPAVTPPSGAAIAAAGSPVTSPLPGVALTSSAVAAMPRPAARAFASQSNPVSTSPAAAASSVQVSRTQIASVSASASPPASATAMSQQAPLAVAQGKAPPVDSADVAMLLDRGKDFLAAGDLSSAQLLLRRAAEAGSAEAALMLASTYDPRYLAAHNVIGVIGDEVNARTWYQRAAELGSPEAARILAQLGTK